MEAIWLSKITSKWLAASSEASPPKFWTSVLQTQNGPHSSKVKAPTNQLRNATTCLKSKTQNVCSPRLVRTSQRAVRHACINYSSRICRSTKTKRIKSRLRRRKMNSNWNMTLHPQGTWCSKRRLTWVRGSLQDKRALFLKKVCG
jgi:hypothetical protein